jgi:translation initiation factor IF-3
MQKDLRANNQIRVPEVQVIDDAGAQLGKMRTFDALNLAKEKGLDLVEVGPQAQPPIAKIMDFGKFMYRKAKSEKKSQARPKDQETKNIKIGFKTGVHDLKVKSRKIDEFLNEGYMVKLDIFLRGREKSMFDMAKAKLTDFLTYITEPYTVINEMRRSPTGWGMFIKKGKK